MAALGAALRGEMAADRAALLKWAFLSWVGQFAAFATLLAFVLRSR
jgi:hypothetical protein